MPSMRYFINLIETVIDFNDRLKNKERDDITTAIRKAIASLPYREAERKRAIETYHTDGKLPLPIGTKMIPPKASGYSKELASIVGYHVDRKNPEMYGYEVKGSDNRVSILWVCNPQLGVYEKRPDVVSGWSAMLGPDGASKLNFKAPTRKAEPIRGPSETSPDVSDDYHKLFGD